MDIYVQVTFKGTGRGAIAMEDVPDGGEILSLPLHLCLTNQTAAETEWGRLSRRLNEFEGWFGLSCY